MLESGQVLALAAVRAASFYDPMLRVCTEQRGLVQCLQSLADTDLSGKVFIFELSHVMLLPSAQRLQQFSNSQLRGLVNILEDGQVNRLLYSRGARFLA